MRALSLALCSCLLLSAAPSRAEDKPYVIGLQPTLTESASLPEGRILSRYLTKALGHRVESRTFTSYSGLTEALVKGDVDFAWINPYSFVLATEAGKVTAIAKTLRHGDAYESVIFVRSDSKVRGLSDLKGLRAAWVDRTSTAGYLFPQALLLYEHLDPAKLFASQSFAGSHGAVCKAVISGAADVGATFHTGTDAHSLRPDGCMVSLGPQVAKQVRGIAVSDPIPNEVIAANANVSPALARQVADVFIHMSGSESGREVLSETFHADGFAVPMDSDFDTVRAAVQVLPAQPIVAEAVKMDAKPYVLGLQPTLGHALSVPEGNILAKYLSQALGHSVESRAFTSYDDLTNAIARGDIDFAWINPYSFVQASGKGDVTPIAKAIRHGESYRSVLFVRARSRVQKLADLKGLRVAWVDRTSTAGYLFPKAMLLKDGLDPDRLFRRKVFAGSHGTVCKDVLSGRADVGATFHTGMDAGDLRPDGCVVTQPGDVAHRLRGIAISDPIPTEVIAVRPGFDQREARQMAGVFMNMADSESGREILSAVFHADGFGVAQDGDFDSVREAVRTIAAGPQAPPEVAIPAPQVVHFATNQAQLPADATAVLDQLAATLKQDARLRVHINGYTDAVASAAFNLALSQHRAAAVRLYLIQHGIAANRLIARGFGTSAPVATNDTEDGRQANRRVEIAVFRVHPGSRKSRKR